MLLTRLPRGILTKKWRRSVSDFSSIRHSKIEQSKCYAIEDQNNPLYKTVGRMDFRRTADAPIIVYEELGLLVEVVRLSQISENLMK